MRIVRKTIEEHRTEFGEIYQNFHNRERIAALCRRIGLTEEHALRQGGGLGCAALVVIVVVVVVVCIWIVFC